MDGSGLVTEVLVNHTPYETRVAILEGGVILAWSAPVFCM